MALLSNPEVKGVALAGMMFATLLSGCGDTKTNGPHATAIALSSSASFDPSIYYPSSPKEFSLPHTNFKDLQAADAGVQLDVQTFDYLSLFKTLTSERGNLATRTRAVLNNLMVYGSIDGNGLTYSALRVDNSGLYVTPSFATELANSEHNGEPSLKIYGLNSGLITHSQLALDFNQAGLDIMADTQKKVLSPVENLQLAMPTTDEKAWIFNVEKDPLRLRVIPVTVRNNFKETIQMYEVEGIPQGNLANGVFVDSQGRVIGFFNGRRYDNQHRPIGLPLMISTEPVTPA